MNESSKATTVRHQPATQQPQSRRNMQLLKSKAGSWALQLLLPTPNGRQGARKGGIVMAWQGHVCVPLSQG